MSPQDCLAAGSLCGPGPLYQGAQGGAWAPRPGALHLAPGPPSRRLHMFLWYNEIMILIPQIVACNLQLPHGVSRASARGFRLHNDVGGLLPGSRPTPALPPSAMKWSRSPSGAKRCCPLRACCALRGGDNQGWARTEGAQPGGRGPPKQGPGTDGGRHRGASARGRRGAQPTHAPAMLSLGWGCLAEEVTTVPDAKLCLMGQLCP